MATYTSSTITATSNFNQKQINLLISKYLIQTQTGTTILGALVAVVRSNRYININFTNCSSVRLSLPRKLSISVSCLARSDRNSCLEPSRSSLAQPNSCSSCCRVELRLTISNCKRKKKLIILNGFQAQVDSMQDIQKGCSTVEISNILVDMGAVV